jgi:hypothetical protein
MQKKQPVISESIIEAARSTTPRCCAVQELGKRFTAVRT